MKTVTYICDECGQVIDPKGNDGPSHEIFGNYLSEVAYHTGVNNPIPEGLHYHKSCFERIVLPRMRNKSTPK